MTDGLPGDEPLDFQILSEEHLAGDFRPLKTLKVEHASLSGGAPHRVSRELVRAGTAAAILPYDPATDSIVVIRQFRIGAAIATPHAAPLELPAGLLDEGERPAEAARRELIEETGLEAQAMEEAFTILSSPGLTDETIVVFLALVDASNLAASAGMAEENEDILPLAFPARDLISACDEGRIANGFLFAGLQWFARRGREHADRLSREWNGRPAT